MNRILLVDDDDELTETIHLHLSRRAYAVRSCRSAAEAQAALQDEEIDVVVTDLAMPGGSGIELCERVVARRPDIPVILLTAFGSMESAVLAMRAGAYDFLSKPVQLPVLSLAIERAARHRGLREQVRLLQQRDAPQPAHGLLGGSSAIRKVVELVDRLAQSDATVLVTGESGSGKELVARAIHGASRRRGSEFIAVNCAAIPEALLESELFGHVRGAYTDARTSAPGLFVLAQGGTLFLDEIAELPLGVQPKLLRVLQERTVRAVGASTERPIDVRIIAATNRDLETAVEDGRFRQDLFYRVNVVQVAVPPLRARPADIVPLARHFVREQARLSGKPVVGFTDAAVRRLMSYTWPGNVRELQNTIERAVALTRLDHVSEEDLPAKIVEHKPNQLVIPGDAPGDIIPLEQLERQYIARALHAAGGNKSAAARLLGIDRKRLYRMLERLGLS